MSRTSRLLFALLLPAISAGCATNTVTGRDQFVLVSEAQAIAGSASAYTTMVGQYAKKRKLESGTARALHVASMTNRLVAEAVRFRPDAAAWHWEVRVIDDAKTVNAFCMAGGKMGIYTGFWEKLNATDDEIAAVMGHEIGHALASHSREKMSVSMATSAAVAVLAAVVASRSSSSNAYGATRDAATLAAGVAITLPNSREAELEADQIGVELAARAGFDPHAAVTLWEKMAALGRGTPEFLSTHPAPDNRAERLRSLIARVAPLYERAKKRTEMPDIPQFVNVVPNERPVASISREDYVKRTAGEADTLSFVSADFERFRMGATEFVCTAECALGYAFRKGAWKALHEKKAWRDLAIGVMKVGYRNDLSYFLLAEAASGLAMTEAANIYRRRAMDARKAGQTCGGAFSTCEGFDMAGLDDGGVTASPAPGRTTEEVAR